MPRLSALHILRQCLDRGIPLDDAISADRRFPDLSDQDRGLCRHLVATAIRRRGQIDAIIERCLETPLPETASGVRQVLRIGACQILFMEVPDYAAVDTSVRLAGSLKEGNYRGFINAVLRRISREGGTWRDAQDAERLNTPDWLWQSWCTQYGEQACREITAAHLHEPPLDITIKENPDEWAERLSGEMLPNGSLRLRNAGRVERLPGYAAGSWWVQDAAATLPARLLASQPDMHVIDLCAAPGGKTAQIAMTGAAVTAVDRSKPRMARLRQNLERIGLEAETVIADAAEWRPKSLVDAVLLDAPCTATGTIRRHPDIAWLKSSADVLATSKAQTRLLEAGLQMLRVGGRLVYAVCSLEEDEGEKVIDRLIAGGAPAQRSPISAAECDGLDTTHLSNSGDLRILPCQWSELGGVDGFYIARLERYA